MYLLLDANVTAAYYLPLSTDSVKVRKRIEVIFDSVRSGATSHIFYLPNFCVAEVFSVFMKYSFGSWNPHVQQKGRRQSPQAVSSRRRVTLHNASYAALCRQFHDDIHNGRLIYHYELSRYHVLAINLVAPVDHYFQYSRATRVRGKGCRTASTGAKRKLKRPDVRPASTFDHLIIAMGVHLARVHGRDNVAVISDDRRLTDVLAKCKGPIPRNTLRKLKLDGVEDLTGIRFAPEAFPQHLNLRSATTRELQTVLKQWPLPVGRVPGVYRWTKPTCA